jgi:rhodanese-related sulfurtransferase
VIDVHRAVALAAIVLGGAAAASESRGPADARRLAADIAGGRDRTTAVALAERIKAGAHLNLFDLRNEDEFRRFHIPSAEQATLGGLLDRRLPHAVPIVLYAGDGAGAAQAWAVLRVLGYRHVTYLREGLYEWIVRVHEPALAVDATTRERAEFERLSALSRYFGGQPRLDVPRAEIPTGYWTAGGVDASPPSASTALLVAAIRRRGC